MLVKKLCLGLDEVFDKLWECWIWITSSPGSASLDGYYPGVGLYEILPSPGAGLEFVPEGGGQPGERMPDDDEGRSDVLLGQELVVHHVAGPGPHLGVYEGIVLTRAV